MTIKEDCVHFVLHWGWRERVRESKGWITYIRFDSRMGSRHRIKGPWVIWDSGIYTYGTHTSIYLPYQARWTLITTWVRIRRPIQKSILSKQTPSYYVVWENKQSRYPPIMGRNSMLLKLIHECRVGTIFMLLTNPIRLSIKMFSQRCANISFQ